MARVQIVIGCSSENAVGMVAVDAPVDLISNNNSVVGREGRMTRLQ